MRRILIVTSLLIDIPTLHLFRYIALPVTVADALQNYGSQRTRAGRSDMNDMPRFEVDPEALLTITVGKGQNARSASRRAAAVSAPSRSPEASCSSRFSRVLGEACGHSSPERQRGPIPIVRGVRVRVPSDPKRLESKVYPLFRV